MTTISRDGHDISGATAQRPTNAEPGILYYDTTLDCLCAVNKSGTCVPVSGLEGVVAVAAAGTNQGTAATLISGVLNLVTAADGTKGVVLPTPVYDNLDVFNSSTSPLFVYPGSTNTINGGAASTAVEIKANTVASFIANSTTAWSAILNGQNASKTLGGSTAAAGTNAGTATALPAATAEVYPVTASDNTKGVILNAADNVAGRYLLIANGVSTTSLIIYPPTGGTINGAAANAAYTGAAGKGIQLYCSAAGTWYAWG